MTKPPPSPLRTVAGALLALLAFAMTPGDVRAGCSHPLASTPAGATRLDGLADLGALADEPAPPPPSPCDGIRCSGDPAPGPIPTVTVVDRSERWGCLAVVAIAGPSVSPHPMPAPTSLRPSHGGPAPFHPPRP